MDSLRVTLLSDGPSDRALQPLLRWLLTEAGVRVGIEDYWADMRVLSMPPRKLPEKIRTTLNLYPCDLFFVHRDAEDESLSRRRTEIEEALRKANVPCPPAVAVVPVRMTEAWLLFDESAIRSAAGNPRGAVRLLLPPMKALESISDPKSVLHDLLRKASGLTGRRLREFPLSHRIYRLADSLDSFAPLRGLAAFRSLEEDVRQIVAREGWSVLDGH